MSVHHTQVFIVLLAFLSLVKAGPIPWAGAEINALIKRTKFLQLSPALSTVLKTPSTLIQDTPSGEWATEVGFGVGRNLVRVGHADEVRGNQSAAGCLDMRQNVSP
jgi:hypothetical protein